MKNDVASQIAVIQRILGVLLSFFSFSMLIPAGVSFIDDDGVTAAPFIESFLVVLLIGLAIWYPAREKSNTKKVIMK